MSAEGQTNLMASQTENLEQSVPAAEDNAKAAKESAEARARVIATDSPDPPTSLAMPPIFPEPAWLPDQGGTERRAFIHEGASGDEVDKGKQFILSPSPHLFSLTLTFVFLTLTLSLLL